MPIRAGATPQIFEECADQGEAEDDDGNGCEVLSDEPCSADPVSLL